MQQIKSNQIEEILDKSLQKCINGEKNFINIMFVAEAKYEKNFHRIFNEWANQCKDISMRFGSYPSVLHKEVNGILYPDLKNGEKQYCYANDDMQVFNRENSVVIFERFNWGQAEKAVLDTKDIIKERTYSPCYNNNTYSLENLKMVIATVYPDEIGYQHNIQLPKELLDCFEKYEVIG